MNIISNLIFHCNNRDANTAFVTIRESTAAAPSSSLLNVKFTFKGTSPTNHFARIVRPMNALQLRCWQFSHKETLWQTFFKRSATSDGKRPFCVFEPPWEGGLGTTYIVHLGLIGKRVVDFLLVLIELFSLGVTAEALQANIGSKSAISLQRGLVDPKF